MTGRCARYDRELTNTVTSLDMHIVAYYTMHLQGCLIA
jgi:hypothetical protein